MYTAGAIATSSGKSMFGSWGYDNDDAAEFDERLHAMSTAYNIGSSDDEMETL